MVGVYRSRSILDLAHWEKQEVLRQPLAFDNFARQ
jgi:hypothetical protein